MIVTIVNGQKRYKFELGPGAYIESSNVSLVLRFLYDAWENDYE
jgi:hypothetical protein